MASLVWLRGLSRLRNDLLVSGKTKINFRRQASTTPQKNSKALENLDYTPPKKYWVSYGFSRVSEEIDRHGMHQTFFVTITLCIVCSGFVMAYCPDVGLRDWAQREGYLELRRREEGGLPLIDPNLIDPAKIKLPTEEELQGVEIII